MDNCKIKNEIGIIQKVLLVKFIGVNSIKSIFITNLLHNLGSKLNFIVKFYDFIILLYAFKRIIYL